MVVDRGGERRSQENETRGGESVRMEVAVRSTDRVLHARTIRRAGGGIVAWRDATRRAATRRLPSAAERGRSDEPSVLAA